MPRDSGVVHVAFDLFIIQSWDGLREDTGHDLWNIGINNADPFQTTFGMGSGSDQSFPSTYDSGETHPPRTGASANNELGYEFKDVPEDSTYKLHCVAPISLQKVTITFSGLVKEDGELHNDVENESWGITNFRLWLK